MPKSLWTLVLAVTLVLVSLTATFAAQNVLKSRKSITVVDAHGVIVGDLFSSDLFSGNVMAFEVDQRPFVLRVTPVGLAGTSTSVVFNSNNCSGPPFIWLRDTTTVPLSLLPASAVAGPGHTLYLEDPEADPLVLNAFSGSRWPPGGPCAPLAVSDPSVLLPVEPVVDLDTLFTPPFSVR